MNYLTNISSETNIINTNKMLPHYEKPPSD